MIPRTSTCLPLNLWLRREAIVAVLLGMLGPFFAVSSVRAADNPNAPIAPSCSLPTGEIHLSQYPLLSQKDPAIYRDQSLLSASDTVAGGKSETVQNLACAATVYLMIERGRGNGTAMIDDFYEDPRKHNGNGPGATKPAYVGSDEPWSSSILIEELNAKRPVVLHAKGGPLVDHFLLAVGLSKDSSGNWQVVVSDPWPGAKRSTPGRTVAISLQADPPTHPILGSTIGNLRKVSSGLPGAQADQVAKSAAPTSVPDGRAVQSKVQQLFSSANATPASAQTPAATQNRPKPAPKLPENSPARNLGSDPEQVLRSYLERVSDGSLTGCWELTAPAETRVAAIHDGNPQVEWAAKVREAAADWETATRGHNLEINPDSSIPLLNQCLFLNRGTFSVLEIRADAQSKDKTAFVKVECPNQATSPVFNRRRLAEATIKVHLRYSHSKYLIDEATLTEGNTMVYKIPNPTEAEILRAFSGSNLSACPTIKIPTTFSTGVTYERDKPDKERTLKQFLSRGFTVLSKKAERNTTLLVSYEDYDLAPPPAWNPNRVENPYSGDTAAMYKVGDNLEVNILSVDRRSYSMNPEEDPDSARIKVDFRWVAQKPITQDILDFANSLPYGELEDNSACGAKDMKNPEMRTTEFDMQWTSARGWR